MKLEPGLKLWESDDECLVLLAPAFHAIHGPMWEVECFRLDFRFGHADVSVGYLRKISRRKINQHP